MRGYDRFPDNGKRSLIYLFYFPFTPTFPPTYTSPFDLFAIRKSLSSAEFPVTVAERTPSPR